MIHQITAEKFGIRLRPIEIADAEFIYHLRTNPENSKYIGETGDNISEQLKWIENYHKNSGDYYFCIENNKEERLGTIGIYNIKDNQAEWGRWIITNRHPIAPSSVWLIYHIAFEVLNLDLVYCRTVIDNSKVVSFHDSCGLKRQGIDIGGVTINGEKKDLVIHTLDKRDYISVKERLERISIFSELLLLRNEDK